MCTTAKPAAAPLLAAAALTRPAARFPASAWAGLGYADVIRMFAASLAWYRGLAAGGTARIGQLNLAQPFLVIGWLALLLGGAHHMARAGNRGHCLVLHDRTPAQRTHTRPDRSTIRQP